METEYNYCKQNVSTKKLKDRFRFQLSFLNERKDYFSRSIIETSNRRKRC
jgi:hypothetical protein